MANKKISELTLFATANSTDQIPVNRAGMNGKLTVASLGVSQRYIGEFYQGGVIFHLWKDSLGVQHGLIVSLVNQGTAQYSNRTNATSGAQSTWNGQGNTNLLTSQSLATSGAWKLCNDYSYSTYTDWYLPAIDELVLLWNNRFNVNKTLDGIVITHDLIDQTDNYWSSTELASVPNNSAFGLFATEGTPTTRGKSDTITVRAIRQF